MNDNLITYLPAAGTASRLGGIPKFYLPIKNNESLIGNHIKNLNKVKNNKIVIGTNSHFYKNISELYPKATVKSINSLSMVETVTKLGLNKQEKSLVVMPDTYFSNYKVVKEMRNKLNSTKADVVLGLWKIRKDQKGKLGQCEIEKDYVKKIIDKNKKCQEKYFWGLIMWSPVFNNYINNKDKHFGISLNRAILDNLNIGYVVAEGQYFDCGTFEEYKFMLKNIKE